jgi:hypothetical protein
MTAKLLLTVSLMLLAAPLGSAQQQTGDEFAIYVVEPSAWQPSGDLSQFRLVGDPVISAADIMSYDWQTHTLTVTTNAILRLPRFRTETFSNFVVIVRGERCYAGSFWPLDISARPMPSNIPIIPVPTGRSRALTNRTLSIGINIRFSPDGFVSRPVAGSDVRSDSRVRDVLSGLGKIKAAPNPDPNKTVQRTGASRSAQETNRTSSAAGSRR